ncbi:transporter substrate-binding domain-containing protein [Pseudomonas sp. X10]
MKTITSMTIALSLAGVLGLGINNAHADDSLEQLKQQGQIRVANTQSSPPWSYLNDKNQPDGYDVAIAHEVARRIGIPKVVFVADNFKNFVEGLKTNKYDVVMNDLTPTEERKLQVDFSEPYGVEEFRIFRLEKNTHINGREDLPGKSLGVTSGSSNESWARKHLPESEVRTYDSGGLVFNDLVNGRIDFIVTSWFSGENYRKTNNLPITAVGAPLTYQLSAAALPKGRDSLKGAIDQAITAMIADGTVDRYAKQYIGDYYHMTEGIQKAKAEE